MFWKWLKKNNTINNFSFLPRNGMSNLNLTYYFYITLQNNFWMIKNGQKWSKKEVLRLFCTFSIFNPFMAFFRPKWKMDFILIEN